MAHADKPKKTDRTDSTPTMSPIPPERSFGWGDSETIDELGFTVIRPAPKGTKYRELAGGLSICVDEVGYVVEGLDDYLACHRTGVVEDIPPSYKTLEHANAIPTYTSTQINRYARGISTRRLEQAIRVATGGGHFDADELTIYTCGRKPFVIESPDGAFILATDWLTERDCEHALPHASNFVAGMSIVDEQDPDVLMGVAILDNLLAEHFDVKLAAYDKRTSNSHYFQTDRGVTVRVPGRALLRLTTNRPHDPDPDVLGTHDVEPVTAMPTAATVTLECAAEAYERGDDAPFGMSGVCIGRTPDISRRFIDWQDTPTEATLTEKAWFLGLAESTSNHLEVELETRETTHDTAEFRDDSIIHGFKRTDDGWRYVDQSDRYRGDYRVDYNPRLEQALIINELHIDQHETTVNDVTSERESKVALADWLRENPPAAEANTGGIDR